MGTRPGSADVLVEQCLALLRHEAGLQLQLAALAPVVTAVREQRDCSDKGICRADDQGLDSYIDDGPKAHHAGFERRVDRALALVGCQERGDALNCRQFGVVGIVRWVVDCVLTYRDDSPIVDYRCTDRHVSAFQRNPCLVESNEHELGAWF